MTRTPPTHTAPILPDRYGPLFARQGKFGKISCIGRVGPIGSLRNGKPAHDDVRRQTTAPDRASPAAPAAEAARSGSRSR